MAYAAGLSLVLSVGCGKKDSDDDDDDDAKGTDLADVESIDQLNVSGSLNIVLPDAFEESATASLLAGKRSMEACRLGQTLKEVTKQVRDVGSFFCHLEVEAKKIKFGTKYTINSGGEEFGKVWADNSKAADGRIALYMCQNGKLKEQIEITGVDVDKGTAKGSLHNKGSDGDQSWATALTFDVGFTTAGLISMNAQQKYADSANDGEFARLVDMNIYEPGEGISNLSMASSGSWGGSEFADRGFAKHNGDFGHVLLYNQGTYNDEEFDFSRHGYFDGEGKVVSKDDSPKFADGEELGVEDSDVPDYLKSSFEPDEPEGWDCDADEEVELDPDSAGHQACDEGKEQEEFADCRGDEFEQGEDVEQ
jgi:hypothetical protein